MKKMKLSFMSLRATEWRSNLNFIWGLLRQTFVLLATTSLISCSAMDALLATPTPVILTETPLPTATRIWFPPSATPTPQPFSSTPKTATPEMKPNVGDVILEDDFSDDTLWDIASSDKASAAINNNRLTLSVQSQYYLFSLRHEIVLSDYYVEITAQPGLCKGEDHYGLLVRASTATYYRFVLACNGTARVERYTSGNRLMLEGPLASGDAPPGAPGQARIGVWANGKEMRLFLNGRFQFSIIDPSFPSGTVGVFVRSEGSTPVVVSFSDLVIQEIDN
jgi:hypothetical protein